MVEISIHNISLILSKNEQETYQFFLNHLNKESDIYHTNEYYQDTREASDFNIQEECENDEMFKVPKIRFFQEDIEILREKNSRNPISVSYDHCWLIRGEEYYSNGSLKYRGTYNFFTLKRHGKGYAFEKCAIGFNLKAILGYNLDDNNGDLNVIGEKMICECNYFNGKKHGMYRFNLDELINLKFFKKSEDEYTNLIDCCNIKEFKHRRNDHDNFIQQEFTDDQMTGIFRRMYKNTFGQYCTQVFGKRLKGQMVGLYRNYDNGKLTKFYEFSYDPRKEENIYHKDLEFTHIFNKIRGYNLNFKTKFEYHTNGNLSSLLVYEKDSHSYSGHVVVEKSGAVTSFLTEIGTNVHPYQESRKFYLNFELFLQDTRKSCTNIRQKHTQNRKLKSIAISTHQLKGKGMFFDDMGNFIFKGEKIPSKDEAMPFHLQKGYHRLFYSYYKGGSLQETRNVLKDGKIGFTRVYGQNGKLERICDPTMSNCFNFSSTGGFKESIYNGCYKFEWNSDPEDVEKNGVYVTKRGPVNEFRMYNGQKIMEFMPSNELVSFSEYKSNKKDGFHFMWKMIKDENYIQNKNKPKYSLRFNIYNNGLITSTDKDYEQECFNKLNDLLLKLQSIQEDKKHDGSLHKTRQIRDQKKEIQNQKEFNEHYLEYNLYRSFQNNVDMLNWLDRVYGKTESFKEIEAYKEIEICKEVNTNNHNSLNEIDQNVEVPKAVTVTNNETNLNSSIQDMAMSKQTSFPPSLNTTIMEKHQTSVSRTTSRSHKNPRINNNTKTPQCNCLKDRQPKKTPTVTNINQKHIQSCLTTSNISQKNIPSSNADKSRQSVDRNQKQASRQRPVQKPSPQKIMLKPSPYNKESKDQKAEKLSPRGNKIIKPSPQKSIAKPSPSKPNTKNDRYNRAVERDNTRRNADKVKKTENNRKNNLRQSVERNKNVSNNNSGVIKNNQVNKVKLKYETKNANETTPKLPTKKRTAVTNKNGPSGSIHQTPKITKKESTNSFKRDVTHENKSQCLINKNTSKDNLSQERSVNRTSAFNLRKSNKSQSIVKNSPSMPPKPVKYPHSRNNSQRNASSLTRHNSNTNRSNSKTNIFSTIIQGNDPNLKTAHFNYNSTQAQRNDLSSSEKNQNMYKSTANFEGNKQNLDKNSMSRDQKNQLNNFTINRNNHYEQFEEGHERSKSQYNDPENLKKIYNENSEQKLSNSKDFEIDILEKKDSQESNDSETEKNKCSEPWKNTSTNSIEDTLKHDSTSHSLKTQFLLKKIEGALKKRSMMNQDGSETYKTEECFYKNQEPIKNSLNYDTVAFMNVEKNGQSEKNDRSLSRGCKAKKEEAKPEKQLSVKRVQYNDHIKEKPYSCSKEVFYKNNYIEIDEDPEINSERKKQLNRSNNNKEVAILKSKIDEEYQNVSKVNTYKNIKEEFIDKEVNYDRSSSENQDLNNTKELLDNDINQQKYGIKFDALTYEKELDSNLNTKYYLTTREDDSMLLQNNLDCNNVIDFNMAHQKSSLQKHYQQSILQEKNEESLEDSISPNKKKYFKTGASNNRSRLKSHNISAIDHNAEVESLTSGRAKLMENLNNEKGICSILKTEAFLRTDDISANRKIDSVIKTEDFANMDVQAKSFNLQNTSTPREARILNVNSLNSTIKTEYLMNINVNGTNYADDNHTTFTMKTDFLLNPRDPHMISKMNENIENQLKKVNNECSPIIKNFNLAKDCSDDKFPSLTIRETSNNQSNLKINNSMFDDEYSMSQPLGSDTNRTQFNKDNPKYDNHINVHCRTDDKQKNDGDLSKNRGSYQGRWMKKTQELISRRSALISSGNHTKRNENECDDCIEENDSEYDIYDANGNKMVDENMKEMNCKPKIDIREKKNYGKKETHARSIDKSNNRSIEKSNNRSIDKSNNRSIDKSNGRSTVRSTGRSTVRSNGRSTDRSNGKYTERTNEDLLEHNYISYKYAESKHNSNSKEKLTKSKGNLHQPKDRIINKKSVDKLPTSQHVNVLRKNNSTKEHSVRMKDKYGNVINSIKPKNIAKPIPEINPKNDLNSKIDINLKMDFSSKNDIYFNTGSKLCSEEKSYIAFDKFEDQIEKNRKNLSNAIEKSPLNFANCSDTKNNERGTEKSYNDPNLNHPQKYVNNFEIENDFHNSTGVTNVCNEIDKRRDRFNNSKEKDMEKMLRDKYEQFRQGDFSKNTSMRSSLLGNEKFALSSNQNYAAKYGNPAGNDFMGKSTEKGPRNVFEKSSHARVDSLADTIVKKNYESLDYRVTNDIEIEINDSAHCKKINVDNLKLNENLNSFNSNIEPSYSPNSIRISQKLNIFQDKINNSKNLIHKSINQRHNTEENQQKRTLEHLYNSKNSNYGTFGINENSSMIMSPLKTQTNSNLKLNSGNVIEFDVDAIFQEYDDKYSETHGSNY